MKKPANHDILRDDININNMPKTRVPKRLSADLQISDKLLSKSWSKDEVEEYLNALGTKNRKVLEVLEHEKRTKYYLELKSGVKVPVLCPKCMKGHLSLVEFMCVNESNEKDVLFLSLLRCDNLKGKCDFASSEKISKLTNKLLENTILRSEKISKAAEEKKEHLALLEDEVKRNSFLNVFKAVFRKSPVSVGISSGFVTLSLILSLTFALSVAGNNGDHEIRAGNKDLSIEYRYSAPEVSKDEISLICQGYFNVARPYLCLSSPQEENEFLRKLDPSFPPRPGTFPR